jgi:hypothetical protein
MFVKKGKTFCGKPRKKGAVGLKYVNFCNRLVVRGIVATLYFYIINSFSE